MEYLNKFLLFFIILTMLCFYTTKIHAQSITNFSFEENDTNWEKNNSNIEFTISIEAKAGTQSAQLSNTSETSYGIEQIVTEINPKTHYEISGYAKTFNSPPLKSFLRVAWYESTDGSGSQLKTNDSETISEVSDWRKISVIAESPEQAHSAKIRLLVSSGQILFDEIEIVELPEETIMPTPSISVSSIPQVDNIYISEVMTYPNSNEGEWIELFNSNNFGVTITDWYIDDIENGGGSPKLFSLDIPAQGYASFELTSSLFNNDGDAVRLLTNDKHVIESFIYEESLQGYSLGKINNQFCIQIASQNKTNGSCYSKNILVTPTIISPTTKPTVLSVSTVKSKFTPTPRSLSKKSIASLQIKPTTPTLNPTPKIEVINLEADKSNEINTQPWLLVSGSYSVLAFISLVSKTFIFRYT